MGLWVQAPGKPEVCVPLEQVVECCLKRVVGAKPRAFAPHSSPQPLSLSFETLSVARAGLEFTLRPGRS